MDKNNNNVCDKDEETAKNEVVCNSPYIKVGANCCLDKNKNSVCDSDEKEELISASANSGETSNFSIIELQSDINRVLNTPILLVKDFNTDKYQVYSDMESRSKFFGKVSGNPYFKIVTKKPVMVIKIRDKQNYLKDYNNFYDFVRNNKDIFVEPAIKSKEIFENEFKNGELPKLIYLQQFVRDTANAEKARYNDSTEISSNLFFDNLTFPETVSNRIAQIFYVRVNKYKVNVSAGSHSGIVTGDLGNINLAYNMIVYCNPSTIISLNEECFGQGIYFCQGTGANRDTDFDRYDADENFFLTNLKAYYDPYTRLAQALIDMCDQKYKFSYIKDIDYKGGIT